jgi:hypothetical protein
VFLRGAVARAAAPSALARVAVTLHSSGAPRDSAEIRSRAATIEARLPGSPVTAVG